MNTKISAVKSYVDLVSLKTQEKLNKNSLNLVIEDDVWEKDILIVKSGKYLNEELINKLLKFGIKKVRVNILEENQKRMEKEEESISLIEFIKTQSVLLVENDLSDAGWLVRNLIDSGFKGGNIFVTADANSINKYFKVKKMNFVFIESSLYEKCPKCISKYTLLKNIHTFILIDKNESRRKLIQDNISEIKFINKPFETEDFKNHINSALNQNLLDFYKDEVKIS
jgi:hypothetical protein